MGAMTSSKRCRMIPCLPQIFQAPVLGLLKVWLAMIGQIIYIASQVDTTMQTQQPCPVKIIFAMDMQRQASERVLQKLQEHPDAWTRVDSVLEHSQSQQAKFYALQVNSQMLCVKLPRVFPFLVFLPEHQQCENSQRPERSIWQPNVFPCVRGVCSMY